MLPRKNLVRALKKAVSQPGYAYHAFVRRFRSYLTYLFRDGYSAPPETITLFLTYQCNLRCKMCGQWGVKGSSKEYSAQMLKSQLSVEQVKGIVDDTKHFGPNITLFGGEPLLYKGWEEIVDYIKKAGLRCNIITNGTLLRKHAETIVDLGVDEIIFSLDGPREIHDDVRAAPGTFDRALEGLAAIAGIRQSRGQDHPQVNISGVIFETNYQRLDEVIAVAEQIPAQSVTFHHLIFHNRATYEEHNRIFKEHFGTTCPDWEGFVRDDLPAIDVDLLLQKMGQIRERSRSSPAHISFYPNLTEAEVRDYYAKFDFWPTSYKKRCLSPWMIGYVFPDGSVRPFNSINFSAGNINDHRFTEIWNNDEYRHFRSVVRRIKVFPVCSRCTEFYRF